MTRNEATPTPSSRTQGRRLRSAAPVGAAVVALLVAASASAAEPFADSTDAVAAVAGTEAVLATEVPAGAGDLFLAAPAADQAAPEAVGGGSADVTGTPELATSPSSDGAWTAPEAAAVAGSTTGGTTAAGTTAAGTTAAGTTAAGTTAAGATGTATTTTTTTAPGGDATASASAPATASAVSDRQVTISSPAESARLPFGCTVRLAGLATSAAEATVVFTIMQGSTEVLRGSADVTADDGTTAEMGAQGSWEALVELPAGTYQVVVQVPDDSDGEGGAMPSASRSFSVV